MPAEGSRPAASPTARLVVALAGVAAGILVFVVVLRVAGPRSTERSESARFTVGSAQRLAERVASEGPLLFQDLLGGSRDIWVQHLGGDDWRTFEAHAPGAPRSCFVEWRAARQEFVDACDGRTFPADGTGLRSYRTEVQGGDVTVDLRSTG